jgi:uncharacterized membrane protein
LATTNAPLPDSVTNEIERTTWLDFASVLLWLVGGFNIMDGIAAIANSRYVSGTAIFANLHAWGWFFLAWGIVQVFAGWAVFKGKGWGVIVAIISAFVNALAQLADVKTTPIWSIIIIVLDVILLYGLVVEYPRRNAAAARG